MVKWEVPHTPPGIQFQKGHHAAGKLKLQQRTPPEKKWKLYSFRCPIAQQGEHRPVHRLLGIKRRPRWKHNRTLSLVFTCSCCFFCLTWTHNSPLDIAVIFTTTYWNVTNGRITARWARQQWEGMNSWETKNLFPWTREAENKKRKESQHIKQQQQQQRPNKVCHQSCPHQELHNVSRVMCKTGTFSKKSQHCCLPGWLRVRF